MLTSPTLEGRTLGGFLVQSQLGSGGMGVVYRARDDRLKRTVAIKVLHPKCIADDVLRERFIREGRTAALIDHPNVVRVISAGEEGGIPFLVMEYVEGGTLERMLERRENLPLARCLRIGKQLAEALAAAHRVGVLHRDVKPANVLFTNSGEPKLADFGLAREDTASHTLSQTGILLGTPHYMSPELCEGHHGDARSDLYSLGVVLYAMIEKRLPFFGDSQARILISQIQDPVPPLTQAPPEVRAAVYKALEKDPANRWSSATEFAAALERILEDIYLPAPGAPGEPRVDALGRNATTSKLPAYPGAPGAGGNSARVARSSAALLRFLPRRRGAVTLIAGFAVVLAASAFLARSPRGGNRDPLPSTGGELSAGVPTSAPATGPVASPPVPAEPVPVTPAGESPKPSLPIPVPDPPADAARVWSPAAGFEGLRPGFVRHDPAGLEAELAAAGEGGSEEDRLRIQSAGIAIRRLRRLLDLAFAWYRLHRGKELEVQRTNGPPVRGTLQAVDEGARRIYVESGSSLLNLSVADLASGELVARVLEGNPEDDMLLAALDLLLLNGAPRDSWPLAARARRRGLAIERDREALLAAQVPPAERSAAEAALRDIEASGAGSLGLQEASRDWLRKYRCLPLDPATAEAARHGMRRGGGAASAEDLELYCAARITGKGKSFLIDYDTPEALLANFGTPGGLRVEPGVLATIGPGTNPGVQILKGLFWKEGVIEMKLRAASTFSVFVGWRSPGERFQVVLAPSGEGRVSVSLPMLRAGFEAPLPADGWIDLRVAWAPGKMVVRANGVKGECPLPRDWPGEIGFGSEGPLSWRLLQIYGQAEFAVPAPADVEAPRVRRAVAASWGTWSIPAMESRELTISAGERIEWAAPVAWEVAASYRAAFRMKVAAGTSVAFDFGDGEGRRRIVLGPEGVSGFVAGSEMVCSGPGACLPEACEIGVEILARRDKARIALDSRVVWEGRLDPSSKGGLKVGASGGQATFKELELWELEP